MGDICELPRGWTEAKLEDVCNKITNGGTFTQVDTAIGLPVTRIETISFEAIDLNRVKYCTSYTDKDIEKYRLNFGDILFSHINSDLHLGKTAIFKEKDTLVLHGINLLRIQTNELIYEIFLYYFLKHCRYKGEFIKIAQKAVNQSSINQAKLKQIKIFIPPLLEQHRIVAKIEELFSELDNGVESLKDAKEQLKVYRQAVLKWAFEGKLTEEWRKKQKDNVISWDRRILGEYIDKIEAGKSFRCIEHTPSENQVGIAKVSAVTWGVYNESESKTCPFPDRVREEFIIKEGDFLFSRANTLQLVGACVIASNVKKRIMLSDKILRIKFKGINQKYSLYYLRSKLGRSEIERFSTGNQESMRNIGQDRIRRISIPICSSVEQSQIIQKIEFRLSICDKLEETINQSLVHAEALRQSILKRAFEGKLVPQDPNDEPVEKLLKRIQAEREAELQKTAKKDG